MRSDLTLYLDLKHRINNFLELCTISYVYSMNANAERNNLLNSNLKLLELIVSLHVSHREEKGLDVHNYLRHFLPMIKASCTMEVSPSGDTTVLLTRIRSGLLLVIEKSRVVPLIRSPTNQRSREGGRAKQSNPSFHNQEIKQIHHNPSCSKLKHSAHFSWILAKVFLTLPS